MKMLSQVILTGLLLAVSAASYASDAGLNYKIPFTVVGTDGATAAGVWLSDARDPDGPPRQVFSGTLDGNLNSFNEAIVVHWRYDRERQEWLRVAPFLEVFGSQGQLYAVNLQHHGSPVPFSNGHYAELCTVFSLDAKAHDDDADFIVAIVVPTGSSGSCSSNGSGPGTAVWILPVDATASTSPLVEPGSWSILGAYSDLSTGKTLGWVVYTGSEVDLYDVGFHSFHTLVPGLAGTAFLMPMFQSGKQLYFFTANYTNNDEIDSIYRTDPSGGSSLESFTYPTAAPCAQITYPPTVDPDKSSNLFTFAEPTAQGYAVYQMSLAAGALPQEIYADSSGNYCGNTTSGGDLLGGHVFLDITNVQDGTQSIATISPIGGMSQSPVALVSGDQNQSVTLFYIDNGIAWVTKNTFPPEVPQTTYEYIAKRWDGTTVADFPGGRRSFSLWRGGTSFNTIDRQYIYIFVANPTPCTGGSLLAVDPDTLAGVAAGGLPADTCMVYVDGWSPYAVGELYEPGPSGPYGENSFVRLNPDQSQLSFITAPLTVGTYSILVGGLNGYPSF